MSRFKGGEWYNRGYQHDHSGRVARQTASLLYDQHGVLMLAHLIAYERSFALRLLVAKDHGVSAANPLAHWNPDEDNIYRVAIDPATKRCEVVCLGMDSVDAEAEGTYRDSTELPHWIQERIAVLALLDPTPPTQKVEGVGQRIDRNTYWVLR